MTTDNSKVNINLLKKVEELEKEVKELREIIKEAINLPKGVEPHSYSDLKNKR